MNKPLDATSPEEPEALKLGSHLILDYRDCDDTVLSDVEKIEGALRNAADALGATTLSYDFHNFEPGGVTGVVVLGESHITIHTWPEYSYAAVDIFACGKMDFQAGSDLIQKSLGAKRIEKSLNIKRGLANSGQQEIQTFDDISTDWEKQYKASGAWGLEAAIDVSNCDAGLIRDAEAVRQYVLMLCNEVIDMKRFGETQVVHFGEDEEVAGYSMTQLIETSLISGHFANKTNESYINIFSCKYFDPRLAAEFTCDYFKGKFYRLNINLRNAK